MLNCCICKITATSWLIKYLHDILQIFYIINPLVINQINKTPELIQNILSRPQQENMPFYSSSSF